MTPFIRLKFISVGLMVFCFLLAGTCLAEKVSPPAKAIYAISGITLEKTGDDLRMTVQGKVPPTYTMYELFDPLRLVLDIADARLADLSVLPSNLPQGPIKDIRQIVTPGKDASVVRLEIHLSDDPAYTIERKGNNIVVNFSKSIALPLQLTQAPGAGPSERSNESPATKKASVVQDITVDTTHPGETRVFIKTNGPVSAYKKADLAKSGKQPPRMYIDIDRLKLPGKEVQRRIGTSLAKVGATQRKSTVRVVFDSGLKKLFAYKIESKADGLLVRIAEQKPAASKKVISLIPQKKPATQTAAAAAPEMPAYVAPAPEQYGELIVPKIPALTPAAKPGKKMAPKAPVSDVAATTPPKVMGKSKTDGFSFAGYEKQRITVDFFKIDLHNVFRLFGEISGQNIVVDEAVNGTLTLALNDVPWDFALDIILNLKDLQKEERFNTIVISPKAKQFQWPKAAAESISVKGGEKIEAISVKQRLETPKEVIEAKNIIEQATAAEKKGQMEKALGLYENAFNLWPDNAQLASHIATLCLTQAGMNAKAIHYAKAALRVEPANREAALQAAIASANMKKTEAAKSYFDLAISGDAPAGEALASYAAFAEEYKSYNGALALLGRHEALYGDTLDTMVSRARILDKLGDSPKAVAAYNAILLSGYPVPEDLAQFIRGRIAAGK